MMDGKAQTCTSVYNVARGIKPYAVAPNSPISMHDQHRVTINAIRKSSPSQV